MSPRPYRLGRRAENIEQTRGRIIAAMRELLARDGYRSASLEEVARVADVTRATVYYQFGSKAGLLEAVVGDIQRRGGAVQGAPARGNVGPLGGPRPALLGGEGFFGGADPPFSPRG